MMELYAPRSENDTRKYIDYITTQSGVSAEAVVGGLSEVELSRLMQAMEQYEGFNAKVDTRKEKWVRTTKITLSDGARPISGQEVTVKKSGTETRYTTNTYGKLPAISHLSPGEKIELWIKSTANELRESRQFCAGSSVPSFYIFHRVF